MTRWPKPDGDRGYPGQPDGIVGGPALGWPAGNRGTGTEAEEMLASAVGWWDVASFREGDRWLRNRGAAGPSLDMRLGSSTTPNSNDPLYLRPADRGYVYLPGATGNTISCTAPASATTYRATTTDGTTTTGAATGGAAFALQTAGSWTRVELLDADGATVLDADCNAITSGSATTFTAATGQTVTINRSSTGRKSVAVPSRNLTKSPLMLLGTDDYLEVQGSEQHKWLNALWDTSFTLMVVCRQWATPNFAGLAGKGGRYGFYNYGTALNPYLVLTDGVTTVYDRITAFGAGALEMVWGVRDRRRRRAYVVHGSERTSAGADESAALRLSTTAPFYVGQIGTDGVKADMEFNAAAVFRRALTDREIALVTDYYQGRIA